MNALAKESLLVPTPALDLHSPRRRRAALTGRQVPTSPTAPKVMAQGWADVTG